MNKYIKISLAVIFSVILLYVGFNFVLSPEQTKLFFGLSIETHLISILLILPIQLVMGLELRMLYSKLGKIKLSMYDTITLPVVINLWGFIIPFQGSFIYTVSYIFSKYKKSIAESTGVYFISTSISMSLAGSIGIICHLFYNYEFNSFFLFFCFLLLINPFLLFFIGKQLSKMEMGVGKVKNLFLKLGKVITSGQVDIQLIFLLLIINSVNVALNVFWAYWINSALQLQLTLVQVIMMSLLMKIVFLIKLTPGNLGFGQFASGGLAVLVGASVNQGFLLSAFQHLTLIFVTFSFGVFFSFLNTRHFSIKQFISRIKGTEKTV